MKPLFISDIGRIFTVTRLNLRTCFLWIRCIKNTRVLTVDWVSWIQLRKEMVSVRQMLPSSASSWCTDLNIDIAALCVCAPMQEEERKFFFFTFFCLFPLSPLFFLCKLKRQIIGFCCFSMVTVFFLLV